ncbi:MAG: DUF488 family protein, N3 subclade [Candidatus Acidiferrales bacterium]
MLAPTQELLDSYKKNRGDWADYERSFLELIRLWKIEVNVPRDNVAESCLLCSEETPEHCHRRLAAEYLKEHWGEVEIVHIV